MRTSNRALLLASASLGALGLGTAGAQAQLVQFNYTTSPGTITAPTAASGSSIGQLASQINATLNAAAVVTGGASVVNNPGTDAVSATNTVSANAITGNVAGNLAAPATGALFTVNLANMAAAGGGTAAGTVYQSNTAPTLLGGVGVTAAGVRDTTGATIATTFAGSLNNTATMAGNVIGSSANGNQANNVVGGNTPAAGIAAGTAGSGIVVGPETVRQRTNTVTFTGTTTGNAIPAGAVGATEGLIASGANFFWGINNNGTAGIQNAAGSTDVVYTGAEGASVAPVQGTYTDSSFAGGRTVDLTGVIAASTGQVNAALAGNAIRATTDLGTVTAALGGGMASGSLAQTGNAVQAAATGNAATTGLAVTGGAPAVAGGLAVFSGQTNNAASAASIAALNNLGGVTTAIGASGAANGLTSSTLTMATNTLSAAGAGNQASNSLTIANTVLAGAGGANGAGNLSTGVVRAEESTQAINNTAGPDGPTLFTSPYAAVAADSSGVGAFNSASIGADYAAMNLQRNRGTDTGALTVSGTLTGASVTALGATGATGTTATNSTVALTGNQLLGSAIGNDATTNVGGTQMRLADTATVAAVNLQESLNTVASATVGGTGAAASRIGTVLTNNAVTATVGQPSATGSALTVADNAVRSTAQLNSGTTTLSGLAANGSTAAASAQMTVNARATNATAPQNLDVAFGGVAVGAFDPDLGTTTTTAAPLRFSAVSAQRVGDTGAVAAADAATAVTRGTTIDVGLLNQNPTGTAPASYIGATGTTVSLARNAVGSVAGGNQSTVGVSFVEGMGSVIPGGALAGNAQIVSPNSSRNISATTDNTLIAFTGVGTAGTGGSATTTASQFTGGSVSLDGNAVTARSIANQGQASISGLATLIADGAGGTGATVTLTPGSPDATALGAQLAQASASYLVGNVQRLSPTGADNTIGVSGTVSGTQVSAVTGATSTTVGVTNNTALSVAAGNVFSGGLADLRGTGAATFAAVSDQAASGTRVSSTVSSAADSFAFLATAGRSGAVVGGVTTPGAITASTVSVDGNLSRALGVMNEASLAVTGATVADLSAAGSGRQPTVNYNGAGNNLNVANAEIALASTQSAAFTTAGVDTPVQRTVTASNSNTGVGILGVTPSTVSGSTLSVAGNTVDSRAVANAASQSLSGDYFSGGVALANNQSVTQTGTDAGMSSTTSNARVQIAIAPPVAGAGGTGVVANLANNTVGASTLVNDATQTLAAARPGTVSTTTGRTATSTQVVAGASATPLNIAGADFALANAQSTNGVRASASTTGTNVSVNLPSAGSMASVTGNRVFSEVVGNRLASTTVLPSMAGGVMQLASSQVNTNSTFTSTVSGTTVGLGTLPGSSAASQAMVTNNVIGATAMGNVIRASVGGR